jgi:hypothetical protein
MERYKLIEQSHAKRFYVIGVTSAHTVQIRHMLHALIPKGRKVMPQVHLPLLLNRIKDDTFPQCIP